MMNDTGVTIPKSTDSIGTPYVGESIGTPYKSTGKTNTKDLPQTIGDAITSNPSSVVKKTVYFQDTFLDNFKYLIFFLALVIMLGTFANEKVLVWFLGLVLAGILITNYKVFTKIAL